MSADVTVLDLRLRRRALIGYAVGLGLYALVIVALYPSFKNDTSLNKFTENGSAAAALFGANGPITTPTGWLNANLYANFAPLVTLLLAIGYGASCLAGQDEDGTLGVIVALPIARRRLVIQKLATLGVQAVAIALVTAVCAIAGRGFGLTVSAGGLIGVTVGVTLLGIVFGVLAMCIGAATGSRGTALGITSALAAASYLISSLAPAVHWLHPARYASPFYYAVGNGQLDHGTGAAAAAVLVGAAAALLLAAITAFNRLDVH